MSDESVEEEIAELYRNRDWASSPKWLAPDSPARKLGIDLERATRELERLYPADVCRDLLKTEDGRRLLGPLFVQGYWPGVPESLLLGHDLAEIGQWQVHSNLVGNLRRLPSFYHTRFEVGLWAGLRRKGLDVEYEPRAGTGEKTADFLVRENGLRLALEAKTLDASRLTQASRAVQDAVRYDDSGEHVHGLHFVYTPRSGLLENLAQLAPVALNREAAAIRTATDDWYANMSRKFAPGDRAEIEGLGEILVKKGDEPRGLQYTFDDTEGRGLDYEVDRALRLARKAEEQASADDSVDCRSAIVWIPAWRSPIRAVVPLLQPRMSQRPDLYRRLDWLMLVNIHSLHGPSKIELAACRLLPWSRMDVRGMKFVEGLTSWRQHA